MHLIESAQKSANICSKCLVNCNNDDKNCQNFELINLRLFNIGVTVVCSMKLYLQALRLINRYAVTS